MQTSKWPKRFAKILCAAVFLFVCNAAITFALEPYGSKSHLVWAEYNEVENLDTLLIGSSYVQAGISPLALDEACGTNSLNLGTPFQRLEETYVGIRTAYEDYQIERVILGVSLSALADPSAPNPNSTFLQHWRHYQSLPKSMSVAHEFLWDYGSATTQESVSLVFPWETNHVTFRPAEIVANIKNKVEQTDLRIAVEDLEENWEYIGRGHGAHNKTLNQSGDNVLPFSETIENDIETTTDDYSDLGYIAPARLKTLNAICSYCVDHDIEVLVVSFPMPAYNTVDPKSPYYDFIAEVENVLSPYGIPLFDFNRARDGFFDIEPQEYFSDNTHLSKFGSEVFNKSFVQFFSDYLAGENLDSYFVSPEEAKSRVNYVSAVFADTQVDKAGIHIEARAISGTNTDIEYALEVAENATAKSWVRVEEWSSNTNFDYLPQTHGEVVKMRVLARVVGSPVEFERSRTIQTFY